MDLTEKEIIYSTDKRFDLIKELCHLSKNLYNAALYDVRQYYFETKSYRTWQSQRPIFTKNHNPDYYALQSHLAGEVLIQVGKQFISFFNNKSNKKKRGFLKMAIIDDYNKKQEYESNKLKFFLDFDKYLDSFTSNGVRLKDLLKFIIDENKKYTIDDLDYTFIVRAEEESYESTETRNAIRRNVAIYIKSENIDSKVSLAMTKQPHGEVTFSFNKDDSFYNFEWVEKNLTKLIEFIFYGIEP